MSQLIVVFFIFLYFFLHVIVKNESEVWHIMNITQRWQFSRNVLRDASFQEKSWFQDFFCQTISLQKDRKVLLFRICFKAFQDFLTMVTSILVFWFQEILQEISWFQEILLCAKEWEHIHFLHNFKHFRKCGL